MAEQYPTDVTLNALSGSTDGQQEVAYPTIAESPYYTSFYKMLYRLLDVARRAGDLRVFKDGTNTFGVRAGKVMVGDTAVEFDQASGQSLANDATNYIYLTAAGTLTVNTTGFPGPSTTPHLPLATIAVGSESEAQVDDEYDFVDITDYRGVSMFRVLGEVTGVGGKVRNATGSGMTAGDLVYISGYNATDDCPEAALADADDPAKIATHVLIADIDDGDTGTAAEWAVLTADTSGRAVGDELYLSATAGEWTHTALTGDTQVRQIIGVVQTVGASGTVVFMPGLRMVVGAGANFLQSGVQDSIPDLNVTFGAETADEIVVTAQARDAVDNNLAQRMAVRVWVATSEYGAPSATGNTVAIDTGTILQTITANAFYDLISDATGKVEVGITVAGAATRYVMAELDGRIYSSGEITWAA